MPTKNDARTIRGMLVLTALALVAAMLSVVSWPTPARAVLSSAPADPGSITLHVQAARSVGTAAGLVHEGDAVTSYKWMINADDTGDPGTADHQLHDKLPAAGRRRRQRPTPTSRTPARGPRSATPPVRRRHRRPGRPERPSRVTRSTVWRRAST